MTSRYDVMMLPFLTEEISCFEEKSRYDFKIVSNLMTSQGCPLKKKNFTTRTRSTYRLAVVLAENLIFCRRGVVDFANVHQLVEILDTICQRSNAVISQRLRLKIPHFRDPWINSYIVFLLTTLKPARWYSC